jgi:hypothetical protein
MKERNPRSRRRVFILEIFGACGSGSMADIYYLGQRLGLWRHSQV